MQGVRACGAMFVYALTILIEDVKALLDQKRGVQYDQAIADR